MALGIVNTGGEQKKLTLQLNGKAVAEYDGSEPKNVNVTPASIGAVATGLARYKYLGRKIFPNFAANDMLKKVTSIYWTDASNFDGNYDFYASGDSSQFIEYRLFGTYLAGSVLRISFTLYNWLFFTISDVYNFSGGMKVVLNAKTKDTPNETTYFTLAQFSKDSFEVVGEFAQSQGREKSKRIILDVDLAWYETFYGVVLDDSASIRFIFTESDSNALIAGLTFYLKSIL